MARRSGELYYSPEAMMERLRALVVEYLLPIKGCKATREYVEDTRLCGTSIIGMPSVSFERGWATEVRVEFRARYDFHSRKEAVRYVSHWGGGEKSIDEAEVHDLELEVYIGWSSSTRSTTAALACLALYREVLEAAATVESTLASDCRRVARLYVNGHECREEA